MNNFISSFRVKSEVKKMMITQKLILRYDKNAKVLVSKIYKYTNS